MISKNNLKEDCYGCGMCELTCPVNAIKMEKDDFGFLYPSVSTSKCINCDKCDDVCILNNVVQRDGGFGNTYAAVSAREEDLNSVASGGAFTAIARSFLNGGGCVCGCELKCDGENKSIVHSMLKQEEELYKIQGSKYGQSDFRECAMEIKGLLKNKQCVLFSGTPCQVAGLKKYIGPEDDGLYTIDLMCHGVESPSLVFEYFRYLEKKYQGRIIKYIWRDKDKGSGVHSLVKIKKKNGKIKTRRFATNQRSFWYNYQNSYVNRSSCYNCKFACKDRQGDLTLGDFWGIEKVEPGSLIKNGGKFNVDKGISAIIVNSEKGKSLLKDAKKELITLESSYEKMAMYQSSLNGGIALLTNEIYNRRKEIYSHVLKGDYCQIEKTYQRTRTIKDRIAIIKDMLPLQTKNKLKQILGR